MKKKRKPNRTSETTSEKAGRQEGRKARRHEGTKARRHDGKAGTKARSRKAGRQEGRKAGRQAGRKEGRKCSNSLSSVCPVYFCLWLHSRAGRRLSSPHTPALLLSISSFFPISLPHARRAFRCRDTPHTMTSYHSHMFDIIFLSSDSVAAYGKSSPCTTTRT